MDPISIAMASFAAVKTGVKLGKDITSLGKDLGKLFTAIDDAKNTHERAAKGKGSAQEKALNLVEVGALEMADVDSEIDAIIFGGEGLAINMSAKKGVVKPINWGSGLLRAKGEHVTASATTSASIVISGLKGIDSGNLDLAKDNINKLFL